MTDLSKLTDEELLGYVFDGSSKSPYTVREIRRRLADLRAERDEAYEDSRRSLDRMNRLVLGVKAAEAERDRLREALEGIARRFHTSTELVKVVRAALKEEK